MYKKFRILACVVFTFLLTGCGVMDSAVSSGRDGDSLKQAISFGSLEWVKECIAQGASIDGNGNFIPYDYAISAGSNNSIADYLLECGVNLNYLDAAGLAPLMRAAANGNVRMCQKYVEVGADIELVSPKGYTALDYAALYGAEETVIYLIDSGSVPTKQTLELALAQRNNSNGGWREFGVIRAITEKLVQQGIDTGFDAMTTQAILGQSDELLTQLWASQMDEAELQMIGYYAAAFCNSAVLEACAKQGFQLVQHDEIKQPIQVAAMYGNKENVLWLIDHWSEYEAPTGCELPLMEAAASRQYEVVSVLLDVGAQIAPQEQDGVHLSALSEAAENADLEMLDCLLASGQKLAHSALSQAVTEALRADAWECVSKLLHAGSWTEDELRDFACLASEHVETIQLLAAYGVDFSEEELLFSFAAQYGNYETAAYLLSLGFDPNTCSEGFTSPLMMAVYRGYCDMVKLLVDYGADVNQAHGSSGTPLRTAVMSSAHITEFLLTNGGDVNQTTESGETLLMTACQYGRLECVEVLIAFGADISAADQQGRTARDYASTCGNQDILALLP